jgi:CubicO group peptidase (beta-lactamase class C family)
MKRSFDSTFLLFLVLVAGLAVSTQALDRSLPRSLPEAQGVSAAELLEFIEAADAEIDAMHSFMLVRHGQVIAEGWWEPYNPESPHMLYSLSKSFTSTAVGMAVAEGRLSIDDRVLDFFPEEAPAEISYNLKAMRVRDLLSMSKGHQDEPSSAADTISAEMFLAQPVPHLPGTHFKYNTAATFMLSAIVQQRAGESVLDYLRPRLFEPLGIKDPVWDTNSQGISLGGYGLWVRTEDIAKLGQLYLQSGVWNDRQLLPGNWVELATSRQVSNGSHPENDWNQGYGFQFWRCRHGAYRGDGAFGQYCIVLPEQDAVIAITSGVRNMQAVLDLIWEKLLPAFRPVALPPNAAAAAQLRKRLATLEIVTAEGHASPVDASGLLGRRFRFEPNDLKLETVSLTGAQNGKGLALTIRADGNESELPCSQGLWRRGRGNIGSLVDTPVAGSFGWPDHDTCQVRLCAYETPYIFTLNFRFNGDQLKVDGGSNVGFGPSKWPELSARLE